MDINKQIDKDFQNKTNTLNILQDLYKDYCRMQKLIISFQDRNKNVIMNFFEDGSPTGPSHNLSNTDKEMLLTKYKQEIQLIKAKIVYILKDTPTGILPNNLKDLGYKEEN